MARIPVRENPEVPEGLDLLGPGDHACLIQEPGVDPLPTILAFLRCRSEGTSQALAALAPETAARLHQVWPGRGLRTIDAPAGADEIAALGSELSSSPLAQRRVVVDMNLVAARNLREILRGEATLQNMVDEGGISLLCIYERRPERADLLLEVVRMHPAVISSGLVGRNDACMPAAELLEAWDPASELDEVLSEVLRRPLAGKESTADTSGHPPDQHEVIVRDADLTVTYVSEALAVRLGARREDLIGGTDFQLWSEPVARRRRSAARRVMRSGEPEVRTEQSLDAWTGTATLRVVRKPILDERGEPKAMVEARGADEGGPPKGTRPAHRVRARLELTPAGTVVEWGRDAAELYLYGAEEMLGRHYTHLLPPHARAAGRELLAEAAAGKAAQAEALLHVTRYGDTLPLNVSVAPLSAEDGTVFALEVGFETVEKQPGGWSDDAEAPDHPPFAGTVPDYTYVYDTDAQEFSYLSPWTALALGVAEEELTLGQGPVFVGRVHPNDAVAVAEAQARLEAGQTRQCTLEYRVAGDGGRHVRVCERRTAVAAESSGPTSFAGEVWIRDEEGRPRAFFARALDHIPDRDGHTCRMLLKDADLTYAWADPGWAESVGLEPPELIGKTDADLYPEALAETFTEDDRRFVDNGERPGFSIGSAFRDHEGRMWERHKVRLTGADGGVQGL
ncbi:MAG: PAS domain-containing protein, partial [Candidatus Brocadiia bacterium]